MIGHILWEMFGWPAGIVVGNLIASAITTTIAHVWLHRKLNRHHQWHVDQARPKDA